MMAPVSRLNPSWAASCAQGTAVALRHDNCVLLFLRGPATSIWRPSRPASAFSFEISGLKVTSTADMGAGAVQFAPLWLPVGPHSICAMTGLATDVEHLFRVLQKQVDNHWNIYDEHMTTHTMTTSLADTFQAAPFQGDRPFGVQCLLIGGDDSDKERIFGIYSIDPSGAWQAWGEAAAIGKYAKTVREALAKKKKEAAQPPSSLKEALEQLVECWMETCKKQNIKLHAASDEDYQVLVLCKETGDSSCKMYAVDSGDVSSIVDQAIAAKTTTQ